MTAEERIAEHVEEIASRHLAEMKAGWRPEVARPYRCETCGSGIPYTHIGYKCFAKYLADKASVNLRTEEEHDVPDARQIGGPCTGLGSSTIPVGNWCTGVPPKSLFV